LLAICGVLIAMTASARADKVDRFIEAEMKRRHIPGLALAVVRDGKPTKVKAYGLADIENDVRVTPDSVFELASITKQFTATAVMLLVEEGKLRLEDPISRYLPEPTGPWKEVTVRHLLTHTSGLPGFGNDLKNVRVGPFTSTAQVYDAVSKDGLEARPGERWQYSDSGYFLLGMIIEKASGKRWGEFLTERIFRPLGMSATSTQNLTAILKHRVHGYGRRKGEWINIRRVVEFELFSFAGVFSTVKDLAKWDAALDTEKLLKKASLEQMWTPAKLKDGSRALAGEESYGFGWFIGETKGHRYLSHPGLTGTEMTRYPDDRLTVIVLTNLGFSFVPGAEEVQPWGLTKAVAGFYIPELTDPPKPEAAGK
jgi:CubicO group peptidase (beta-lactamase class C family)